MDPEELISAGAPAHLSARLRGALGAMLDGLVRPRLALAGRSWPSYGLFVVAGTLGGILLSLGVAGLGRLSVARASGTLAFAVAVALSMALVLQTVRGDERYTFYHYQIAVLVACAVALAARGGPILAYLDLVGLTLGVALGVGRLGCLLAGCCHGRPHAWGVAYGARHESNGFEPGLSGVRLFPIQAVESIVLIGVVAAIVRAMLDGRHAPGYALASHLILYDGLRFAVEFGRGDAGRPYFLGFSEAQWTSVGSAAAIGLAESSGLLPRHGWHVVLGALIAASLLAVALHRRLSPRSVHRLMHPAHALEIADGLRILASEPALVGKAPRVLATGRGLRLSRGTLPGQAGTVHYALSFQDEPRSAVAARAVARLIMCLRHSDAHGRLTPGGHGVFHLVVPAAR
jgi:hypothetical protein